jgi:hypothetical protein
MPKVHEEMGLVYRKPLFGIERARVFTAIILLAALSLIALSIIELATGSTMQVLPGESLQDAINAAKPGDIIEVHSGTYDGPIIMTKRLILRGLDTGNGMPVIGSSIAPPRQKQSTAYVAGI